MLSTIITRGSVFGRLLILVGLLLGLPLLALPFYPGEADVAFAFLLPMLGSATVGLILCLATYRRKDVPDERRTSLMRGSLVILFAWCYSILLGGVPFWLAGQADPLHAVFESVSGWTTTGFSVLDVDSLPRLFILYRALTQFCGGAGFILMMVVVVQGRNAMPLYDAEGHSERLMPNVRQTARSIFAAYSGFCLVGTLIYCILGMPPLDAICYSMSAASTAGFTTSSAGIAGYGSVAIEMATVVMMLAGSLNFAIPLLLLKGRARQVLRSTELRMLGVLYVLAVVMTTAVLMYRMNMELGEATRQAMFASASAISTTGYTLMDLGGWPAFGQGLMMLLLVIGGSTGSAAGGIKLSRTYFMLRIAHENILSRLSPAIRMASPSFYDIRGKSQIDAKLVNDTFGFLACYLGLLVIGTLLIALTANCSLFEAMFEFICVLGTGGISSGLTHPGTNAPTLIVEMVGMLLGRLEIMVVLYSLSSMAQLVRQAWERR